MSEDSDQMAMETQEAVKLHPDTSLQGKGEDLSVEGNGGLMKHIKTEGDGDDHPFTGDKVTVHYTGFFPDGNIFDSSKHRNEPFNFTVGKGQVIKGWDTVIPSMKKGEVCVITCAPDYAYGENGSPPKIPGNATLMFEIELLSWKGEDISDEQDESMIRRVIDKGEGHKGPNDGATVEVYLTGRCNGVVFEDRDVSFTLGEGSAVGILESVERALHKFKKGEKSLLRLMPSKAYGKEGCPDKGIPSNAVLEYEVHMKNFEKSKEGWEMDLDEKLEQAEFVKQKGTKFFKEQQWRLAKRNYKKIIDYLDMESDLEGDKKTQRDGLMLAAHLNLAMVYLKLADYNSVVESCNSALDLDPNSEKAFFRRGQAYISIQEFDDAIKDFKKCLEIDSNNKAAKNQIAITQQAMKKHKEKEKQRYAGMFQKFASIDSKKAQQEEYRNNDGKVFQNVSHWNNELAKDMMTLEEEAEAFGDLAPEPKFNRDASKDNAYMSTDED